MAEPQDTTVHDPGFLATNQPLPPGYGESALVKLQEKWNYAEEKPVQDFLQQVKWETYHPYNTDYKDRNQNEVNFIIPGNTTDYISKVNVLLDVEPRIREGDAAFVHHDTVGHNVDATGTIPRPLIPFNMFKEALLDTNNGRIDFSRHAGMYPLHMFLHMIHSVDEKDEDRLKESHDFDMPPYNVDPDMAVDGNVDSGDAGDERPEWHKSRVAKLKRQTYIVPLNIPVLKATPLLPVGANVSVTLVKNEPQAIFHRPNGNNTYMKIYSIQLWVQRSSLKPNMLSTVLAAARKAGTFKFNIIHTHTNKFQLPAGCSTSDIMFAQAGTKPSKVWVNFMDDRALVGNTAHSIFKLVNPKIKRAVMSFDGNQYPFPNGYEFPPLLNPTALQKRLIYEQMCMAEWGHLSHEAENTKWWTQERFENFAHTVVFDLTASQTAHLNTMIKEKDESGVVSLRIDYHETMPEHMVMLATCMYATEIYQSFVTLQPELNAIV